MKRLFVAIDLPEAVKKKLWPLCCGVQGARWMQEDQMHVTLLFLGEIDNHAAADLDQALASIQHPGFALALKGVGHFPPRGAPRVLWAGVDKNEALYGLQRKVQSAAKRLGLETEERNFHAHVTLARLRDTPVDDVGRFLQAFGLFRCEPFDVRAFQLFSSTLNPRGARYALEATYALQEQNP